MKAINKLNVIKVQLNNWTKFRPNLIECELLGLEIPMENGLVFVTILTEWKIVVYSQKSTPKNIKMTLVRLRNLTILSILSLCG